MRGGKTAWVKLMAVIYRPFRDWSSELWRFAKLETLLSHGWLYVQLTIMANNTFIPSPSHHLTVGRQTMGRARVSEAIFQRRTKHCHKNVGVYLSISTSPVLFIASLISQVRLEKCCWSEIEYIRNPINDFGCLLAGLVSPRQNIMNFKAISQILSEKNCN